MKMGATFDYPKKLISFNLGGIIQSVLSLMNVYFSDGGEIDYNSDDESTSEED